MKDIFFLYAIFLLLGLASGFFFPASASMLLFVSILVITILATELIGSQGFGDHWCEYRITVYITYPLAIVIALLGILLGSGKVGTFLITIGTLLSRQ